MSANPNLLTDDLHAARARIRSGASTPRAELERCLEAAQSQACAGAFLCTDFEAARALADAPSTATTPLAGSALSIKDLYDVEGQVTRAGSVCLDRLAAADAACVARLRAAGANPIGRSHMNEFAFSGMGLNPHFAQPRNPLDAATPRLTGGSSSGAGVSVATGAAFIGLGSDTGGSVRIPAAMCGVIGFKPTTGVIPTHGSVPLSTTLDTVGAVTRSVRDAALAFEVLSGQPEGSTGLTDASSLRGKRLLVPSTLVLDSLDPAVATAFERAVRAFHSAGAQVRETAVPELAQVAALQKDIGFSSTEGLNWHRQAGTWGQRARWDPRVVARMRPAENAKAIDYIELVRQRAAWVARMNALANDAAQGFDVLICPTVPITARPIADMTDDGVFFATNALMLRNTSLMNFWGAPSISLPIQLQGNLGVGLMLTAAPGCDAPLLQIAQAAEAAARKQAN